MYKGFHQPAIAGRVLQTERANRNRGWIPSGSEQSCSDSESIRQAQTEALRLIAALPAVAVPVGHRAAKLQPG